MRNLLPHPRVLLRPEAWIMIFIASVIYLAKNLAFNALTIQDEELLKTVAGLTTLDKTSANSVDVASWGYGALVGEVVVFITLLLHKYLKNPKEFFEVAVLAIFGILMIQIANGLVDYAQLANSWNLEFRELLKAAEAAATAIQQ